MGIYLLIPHWRRKKARFLELFYTCSTYYEKLDINQVPQREGIIHSENIDIYIWWHIKLIIKIMNLWTICINGREKQIKIIWKLFHMSFYNLKFCSPSYNVYLMLFQFHGIKSTIQILTKGRWGSTLKKKLHIPV